MGSRDRMGLLRRKQTKQQHATDWLGTAAKAAAVGVLARGAGQGAKKGAKKGARKGAKTVAKRGGKSLGRRLAPLAAIGTVAFVAAKKLRGSKGSGGGGGVSPDGAPTPARPRGPPT